MFFEDMGLDAACEAQTELPFDNGEADYPEVDGRDFDCEPDENFVPDADGWDDEPWGDERQELEDFERCDEYYGFYGHEDFGE